MRTIRGKCHCGNIEYQLSWPGSDEKLAVRACSCSFCTKHGGVYTSHPEASLKARVSDGTRLSKYAFGTQTADFYVCSGCGVVPFVTSTIDGSTFAVVNVNTFENVAAEDLVSSTSNFDGEDVTQRLDRRKRNWIPRVVVEIEGG